MNSGLSVFCLLVGFRFYRSIPLLPFLFKIFVLFIVQSTLHTIMFGKSHNSESDFGVPWLSMVTAAEGGPGLAGDSDTVRAQPGSVHS